MPDVYERTARVILTIGDHVLLARGQDNAGQHECFFHIPGGHVDGRETPAHAVLREMREETRRQVVGLEPVMVYANVWQRGSQTVHEELHLFHGTLLPMLGEHQPQSNEAHLLFEWIPSCDLLLHDVRPAGLVPVLRRYASV